MSEGNNGLKSKKGSDSAFVGGFEPKPKLKTRKMVVAGIIILLVVAAAGYFVFTNIHTSPELNESLSEEEKIAKTSEYISRDADNELNETVKERTNPEAEKERLNVLVDEANEDPDNVELQVAVIEVASDLKEDDLRAKYIKRVKELIAKQKGEPSFTYKNAKIYLKTIGEDTND